MGASLLNRPPAPPRQLDLGPRLPRLAAARPAGLIPSLTHLVAEEVAVDVVSVGPILLLVVVRI